MLTAIRHLEIRAAVAREQALACIREPHTERFDFWWVEWSHCVTELTGLRFRERTWHD